MIDTGGTIRAQRSPTRRYEQRQSAIIASAVEVLNRKGVRGMTLGEVASRLDLVPTGVVYYFRNKEELAAACFLRGVDTFKGFIDHGAASDDPRERVRAFIGAYADFQRQVALGETQPLAKFNDVRALRSEAVDKAYVDMFRGLRGLFEGPETAALTRAERNARAHLLLTEVLWMAVWLPYREPEVYPQAADRLAGILTHGLAAVEPQPSAIGVDVLKVRDRTDAGAEQFLRAATELINEQGYVGASVEKISARLNVTKGAFYHHNQTKDDLVAACFERTFELMRTAIRAAEEATSSGLQALISLSSVLVEYQVSGNAPLIRTSALHSAPVALQPQLRGQFRRITERLASMVRRRYRRRLSPAGRREHHRPGDPGHDQRVGRPALLVADRAGDGLRGLCPPILCRPSFPGARRALGPQCGT